MKILHPLLCAALLIVAPLVQAQEFSALVSPPRFEASAQPGTTYRDVVEITNASQAKARFTMRTADWELDELSQATFRDDLKPGSCRPWVGLERKDIEIVGGGKYRFRFEVKVPADAPVGECRFAMMLEGEPQQVAAGLPIPVSGRLGIIVYLAIGGAKADFKVIGTQREKVEGVERPALRIQNVGNAHDRVEGFIDGVDAQGNKITFTASNLPILAGDTRVVPLTPVAEKGVPEPVIAYPLVLKGKLDWGTQRMDVDGLSIP